MGIANGRMPMSEGADASARPFRETFNVTIASTPKGLPPRWAGATTPQKVNHYGVGPIEN